MTTLPLEEAVDLVKDAFVSAGERDIYTVSLHDIFLLIGSVCSIEGRGLRLWAKSRYVWQKQPILEGAGVLRAKTLYFIGCLQGFKEGFKALATL